MESFTVSLQALEFGFPFRGSPLRLERFGENAFQVKAGLLKEGDELTVVQVDSFHRKLLTGEYFLCALARSECVRER
jgi:hypothetical protein